MKKLFVKHRIWFLGLGTGLLSSLAYFPASKLLGTAAIFIALAMSVISFHLVFRFLLSFSNRKQIYFASVLTGLAFESFAILLALFFPGTALSGIGAFLFMYAAIFLTTLLIMPLLIGWGLLFHFGVFYRLAAFIEKSKVEQVPSERFS